MVRFCKLTQFIKFMAVLQNFREILPYKFASAFFEVLTEVMLGKLVNSYYLLNIKTLADRINK